MVINYENYTSHYNGVLAVIAALVHCMSEVRVSPQETLTGGDVETPEILQSTLPTVQRSGFRVFVCDIYYYPTCRTLCTATEHLDTNI